MQAVITTLVLVVIFAIGNMIRGGWWFNKTFPDPKPWWKKSDLIYSLLHIAAVAPTTGMVTAFTAGVGNHIGASSGLGTYVGGYLNGYFSSGGIKQDVPKPEIGWIDALLKPLAVHQQLYCWLGMLLRGVQWSLCVALLLAVASLAIDLTKNYTTIELKPFDPRWYIGAMGYSCLPIGFTFSKKLFSPSRAWLAGECINGAITGLAWGIALS